MTIEDGHKAATSAQAKIIDARRQLAAIKASYARLAKVGVQIGGFAAQRKELDRALTKLGSDLDVVGEQYSKLSIP